MGSYKEHQNLIKRFKLLAAKKIPSARFFDRHVGTFYTHQRTPIKINKKGMADVYGLIKTDQGLIHIEIEAKTGNARQSYEQKRWQEFIKSMDGLYILLRDEEEAINNILIYLDKLKSRV